ncbi:MAG: serine/threonine-protein kinase [Pirellulaceae bacterium]
MPSTARDPSFAERFSREARALARLSHPNIVAVYDSGNSGGYFYLLMEYVDGVNLREAIVAKTLTPSQALAVVPQICEALQFAHDEGVVHRDIKPENVLLDTRGRVKVADFGLAKLLRQPADDEYLTHTHQVMGTPRYMAPEQMEGSRAVDHRADIYSLGVVFYELLTGELPLGSFDPPSKKARVDARLDQVVLRTLAKEPDRRYQRAGEVKTDVETISGVPVRILAGHGREWRSEAEWFGVPLVHIATGIDPRTGRKRVARGVIAIGDVALGGVAMGGVACGGITLGGVSAGLISLGGLASGLLLAIGGAAIGGGLSIGGLAIGDVAIGGCAIGQYAYGGGAFGYYVYGPMDHETRAVELMRGGPLGLLQFAAQDLWFRGTCMFATALVLLTTMIVVSTASPNRKKGDRDEKSSEPPAKPFFIPLLAIFNIVIGLLSLVLISVDLVRPLDPNDSLDQIAANSMVYQFWNPISQLIGYFTSVALILGGIGLLSWRAWARRLTLWSAIVMLGSFLVELPFVMAYTGLPILQDAMRGDAEFPAEVAVPSALALVGGMLAFGLLYNVLLLVAMSRRSVVEACEYDDSSQPSRGKAVLPPKRRPAGVWWGVAALCVLLCCPISVVALAVIGAVGFSTDTLDQGSPADYAPAEREDVSTSQEFSELGTGNIIFTNDGPQFRASFANTLGLTPAQHQAANEALAAMYEKYLDWESEHRTMTVNGDYQVTTIEPMPEDKRRELEHELWTKLDAAIPSSQSQKLARLNVPVFSLGPQSGRLSLLVQPGLLGWGEYGAKVSIRRMGSWYEWNVQVGGRLDFDESGPQLPHYYQRFWREPTTHDTSNTPGSQTTDSP